MDYPDFDVRSASIEATGYFLMAYFKSGDAAVAEKFSDGLTMFLDTLVGIVKEEEEPNNQLDKTVEETLDVTPSPLAKYFCDVLL